MSEYLMTLVLYFIYYYLFDLLTFNGLFHPKILHQCQTEQLHRTLIKHSSAPVWRRPGVQPFPRITIILLIKTVKLIKMTKGAISLSFKDLTSNLPTTAHFYCFIFLQIAYLTITQKSGAQNRKKSIPRSLQVSEVKLASSNTFS